MGDTHSLIPYIEVNAGDSTLSENAAKKSSRELCAGTGWTYIRLTAGKLSFKGKGYLRATKPNHGLLNTIMLDDGRVADIALLNSTLP